VAIVNATAGMDVPVELDLAQIRALFGLVCQLRKMLTKLTALAVLLRNARYQHHATLAWHYLTMFSRSLVVPMLEPEIVQA
jgi:hypothetical protein